MLDTKYSLYIYISCAKAQLANVGNTICVVEPQQLIVHSAVWELHRERVLTLASVFTLEKSTLLYMLMYSKLMKKGAGQLEKFLSLRDFIREIWYDVWLVRGVKMARSWCRSLLQ